MRAQYEVVSLHKVKVDNRQKDSTKAICLPVNRSGVIKSKMQYLLSSISCTVHHRPVDHAHMLCGWCLRNVCQSHDRPVISISPTCHLGYLLLNWQLPSTGGLRWILSMAGDWSNLSLSTKQITSFSVLQKDTIIVTMHV